MKLHLRSFGCRLYNKKKVCIIQYAAIALFMYVGLSLRQIDLVNQATEKYDFTRNSTVRSYESPFAHVTSNVINDVNHWCTIRGKDARSALKRAKTTKCKQEIVDFACYNQLQAFLPDKLPRFCPYKAKHEEGEYIGCYGINIYFSTVEPVPRKLFTPEFCTQFCLRIGYSYAGLQTGGPNCRCGNTLVGGARLPESACDRLCVDEDTCDYMMLYSTGYQDAREVKADLVRSKKEVRGLRPVRIVFVFTLSGRALRQILRLLQNIYHKDNYYYIHVDSRQHYLYRELLKLEDSLPNLRLARERLATIWGGPSRVIAHLAIMKTLLAMKEWEWDYYINLSESQYPLKPITSLNLFLQKYMGVNFVQANRRLKGSEHDPSLHDNRMMDLTAHVHECDEHAWMIGRRPLPGGIRYDKGSDWICLYRDFVDYVATGTDPLVTSVRRFAEHTTSALESFTHTLLRNSRFCEDRSNNNLHIIDWNSTHRCNCHYHDTVDWCGCSPRVLTQEDLGDLLAHVDLPKFFARKFDPVVDQNILTSIDKSLLGLKNIGTQYYWQNEFHFLDPPNPEKDDIIRTFADSFIRRSAELDFTPGKSCRFSNTKLLETHVLYVDNKLHRYLVKYTASLNGGETEYVLENQFSPLKYFKKSEKSELGQRLLDFEVGTAWDPKVLMFRNYPAFMGPSSPVKMKYAWKTHPEKNITFAIKDPKGGFVGKTTRPIDEKWLTSVIPLKPILRPGVWTAAIRESMSRVAEVKFLILPYSTLDGVAVSAEQIKVFQLWPAPSNSNMSLSEMQQRIKLKSNADDRATTNETTLFQDYFSWIDKLTSEFWNAEGICSLEDLGQSCPHISLCSNTTWSSMIPDPKSEIRVDKDGNLLR